MIVVLWPSVSYFVNRRNREMLKGSVKRESEIKQWRWRGGGEHARGKPQKTMAVWMWSWERSLGWPQVSGLDSWVDGGAIPRNQEWNKRIRFWEKDAECGLTRVEFEVCVCSLFLQYPFLKPDPLAPTVGARSLPGSISVLRVKYRPRSMGSVHYIP